MRRIDVLNFGAHRAEVEEGGSGVEALGLCCCGLLLSLFSVEETLSTP